jgi:hypothetical protein
MIYVLMMVYACTGSECDFYQTYPEPVTLAFCMTQSMPAAAIWSIKHPNHRIGAVVCKPPEA